MTQTLPTPTFDNIKVDTFSPVQFIVLVGIVFLFVIVYAVFNTYQNSKSKSGYTKALQELTSLMQNINTHMNNTNQYIADIRRGLTKEGTREQILEYALTKVTSVMYRLIKTSIEVREQNNIDRETKKRVILIVTNYYNNMSITFDLFLYKEKALSEYLNSRFIDMTVDVLYNYISDKSKSEKSLERDLKLVIDEFYNEFLNNINT
jgi:hypothetical protein